MGHKKKQKKRKLEQQQQKLEQQQQEEEEEEEEEDQKPSEVSISSEDAAKLVEALTQSQLVDVVKAAVTKHSDVFADACKFLDDDITRRKLFVRGLASDTTSATVCKVFEQFGEIQDLHVVIDKQSGKNKGFGFVTFKHVSSAMNALREPSKQIDGRITVCNLASLGGKHSQGLNVNMNPNLPQQPPLGNPSAAPGFLSVPGVVNPVQGGIVPNPAGLNGGLNPANSVNQSATTQVPCEDLNLRRVYIANVPPDMEDAKLVAFFSQYGDIAEGPMGYDYQTGKSRGYSIIIYKTVEATRKCLEDPVKSIEGHQLFCKLASENHKSKFQAISDSVSSVRPPVADFSARSLAPPVVPQALDPRYGAMAAPSYLGLVNPALATNPNYPSLAANPGLVANPGAVVPADYALGHTAGLQGLQRDGVGMGSLGYNSAPTADTEALRRELFLQGLNSRPDAYTGLGSYGPSLYGRDTHGAGAGAAPASSLYGAYPASAFSTDAANPYALGPYSSLRPAPGSRPYLP